jgi:anaerobic selenocysteine-containing dehydrogenase
LAALVPPATALVNPSDLARLGVAPGETVRVSSPRGELALVAAGDSGVPKGVLVVEFNLAEPGHPTGNAVASLIDATAVVNEVRLETQ